MSGLQKAVKGLTKWAIIISILFTYTGYRLWRWKTNNTELHRSHADIVSRVIVVEREIKEIKKGGTP